MITVTERATSGLQELLAINHASPGEGVKLVPNGTGQVGLTIGAPGAGDEVIRYEGAPLLILDSRLAQTLDGAEIDCENAVVDGQETVEFQLRAPG